jgi:hypothetical protein
MSNEIIPSLSGQWSGDKLALRFKLNLPLLFTSTDSSAMGLDGADNNKLKKNGVDQNVFVTQFRPDLRLALQWKILSNLSLNAGGRLRLAALTRTTTEGSTYATGTKTANSDTKQVATNYGTNIQNQLTLGATFNATDNFTIEAVCGAGNTAEMGGNRINTFSTGSDGVFAFGSILVGLKF